VAVIKIVVYAGAIMVLFLFVVMLLNAPHEETEADERRQILLRSGPLLSFPRAMSKSLEAAPDVITSNKTSGLRPALRPKTSPSIAAAWLRNRMWLTTSFNAAASPPFPT
jgi:hypothetical protein